MFPIETSTGHRFRIINDFRRNDDDSILDFVLKNQTLRSFEFILENPVVKKSISVSARMPAKDQLEAYFSKSGFFNYYQVYEPIPISTFVERKKRGWVSPQLLTSKYPGRKPPVFTLEKSENSTTIENQPSDSHLLTHLSCNRSSKGFTPNKLSDKLLKDLARDLKQGILSAVANVSHFIDLRKRI